MRRKKRSDVPSDASDDTSGCHYTSELPTNRKTRSPRLDAPLALFMNATSQKGREWNREGLPEGMASARARRIRAARLVQPNLGKASVTRGPRRARGTPGKDAAAAS